jgi:release factor glutamine methyltransferase
VADVSQSTLPVSLQRALRPPRLPRVARLLGKTLALGYRLIGRDRYDDFRLERVCGVPLLVMPSVFNPKLPRTGALLAAQLDAGTVSADTAVLDMGTGSGVCAVFAARHARRVVAVDINPAAVRCAAINAQINQLDHRLEVRQGDLFEPVAGERFDLVLFNPPFLQGVPRDHRDRAWRSTDVAERFAAELPDHLEEAGAALVVLSTFGGSQCFVDAFHRHGLEVSVLVERCFINERVTILRIAPPPYGEDA